MTNAERRKGHSALRWNKEKLHLEVFDPNPKLTTAEKNRAVCEWLGIEWLDEDICYCGNLKATHNLSSDHGFVPMGQNPDFAADPVALLREMDIRGYMNDFLANNAIPIKYITTPGALLEAVWEWMKKEANHEST
jgi:hypothetical protein